MCAKKQFHIGIDTGGTFTDFVAWHSEGMFTFKLPSTPHDPAEAIIMGLKHLQAIMGKAAYAVVHGTTVATNALLERKGARTALITTAGFEDVLEIGRQARPQLYNFNATRPAPLVPTDLRFGLPERISPFGNVLLPCDETALNTIIAHCHQAEVEAIAVCLLFSFVNPVHENLVAQALAKTAWPISLSSQILPEYREYERTATVVINSYLTPKLGNYLHRLNTRLTEVMDSNRISLRVMQSSGGAISAEVASREPVRTILSGPAGGVIGATAVAKAAGESQIITFDMGGTSTDVALIESEIRTTNEATIAGLPIAVPVLDIHTVGAGGGSIARVDIGGALRVGPESAGAAPGPACYSEGEDPTVTDANLLLGRFGRNSLLGGELTLQPERSLQVFEKLATMISHSTAQKVTPITAALGVIAVANTNMEQALRVVSIERGYDPRTFTLVSFGGAGGLHVAELAYALRIPKILIPAAPGALSALGVLMADVVKDYSRTVMLAMDEINIPTIDEIFNELKKKASQDLTQEGFHTKQMHLVRHAAMRYRGQSFELDLPWSRQIEAAFHQLHEKRYGYSDRTRATELVSLRLRAIGETVKPPIIKHRLSRHKPQPAFFSKVYFRAKAEKIPVYERDNLPIGAKLRGPLIVTEYSATTLLPAGFRLTVDHFANLVIELRK